MEKIKCWTEKMGTLSKQMRGNLCSKKWKHSIEIWSHFVLSDGFALHFDQFENGFNQCGRIITFWIINLMQYFYPTLMFNISKNYKFLSSVLSYNRGLQKIQKYKRSFNILVWNFLNCLSHSTLLFKARQQVKVAVVLSPSRFWKKSSFHILCCVTYQVNEHLLACCKTQSK